MSNFLEEFVQVDLDRPAENLKNFINAHSESVGWGVGVDVYEYQKSWYFSNTWNWRVKLIAEQQWKNLQEAPLKRQLEVMQSGFTGEYVNSLGSWEFNKFWTKYYRLYPGALLHRAENELAYVREICKANREQVESLYLTRTNSTSQEYYGRYFIDAVENEWDCQTWFITSESINEDSHRIKFYLGDGDIEYELIQLFMFLSYTAPNKRISRSRRFYGLNASYESDESSLTYEVLHIHSSLKAREVLERVTEETEKPDTKNMTQDELDRWNEAFVTRSIEALKKAECKYAILRKTKAFINTKTPKVKDGSPVLVNIGSKTKDAEENVVELPYNYNSTKNLASDYWKIKPLQTQ